MKAPLFGVDSMLFVYHFEEHPEFGPAAGRLLQDAEAGRCRLVSSVLARMEVMVVPKRRGHDELCRLYSDFFESFPNLSVRPMDSQVADIAAQLRAEFQIRTPDAFHVATAIHAGAEAFVTADRRLRGLQGIRIMGLDEVG